MWNKRGLWITGTLFLAGCSGNIVLAPLSPTTMGSVPAIEDLNSNAGRAALTKGYKGLLVYLPVQRIEVDRFTQIQVVASDGKTLVLSAADCDASDARSLTKKEVTDPDRTRPYLLQYHHGLLESYTFGATLSPDGTLLSINTSSAPDQGKTLANLTSAASSAAAIGAKLVGGGSKPPCTQTPSFDRYEPIP